MLKPFLILFLLATVIVGTGCQTPAPAPTITLSLPTPAPIVTSTPAPTAIPSPTPTALDPSQFIPLLRQISEPFNQFYGNEIVPLNAEIYWFYKANPPTGVFAYTQQAYNGNGKLAYIYLSHIPNSEEGNTALRNDAFLIAHELALLVISPTFQEGWMLQCQDQQLNMYLQSLLDTPLRDSILAKYHLDVQLWFNFQVDYLKTADCREPSDTVGVHEVALEYALFGLYWQKVLGNQGVSPDVDALYQQCRPNSRKEGVAILALINENKYDTPDTAKALYQQIIDTYILLCPIITSGQTQ